ncbi:MAG: phosphoenolpyruvate--protein phosphotransferase [Kiritimatiellae bacterium]|nr:phosphoenolpyruvate--protein phosphotransferase [Kiritimatiellia bacterium]MDW8457855.1 phosphoenolpyruvate--protein phosphotransferase [Verrucomicrobiota bacterium]
MRKDNVELICNIAELAGLFQKSSGLSDFLQTVVSVVAYHMRAAVCSIYLYDDQSRELVLTATQGLNPESIGKVRLKLGEGLTGLALKELRPIREGRGSRNPNFKFIPGIREEQYQAFLAVPILRGLERVGVLVLQDPVENYFDENDTKALQAIAAQLAATIENAKLLITLHQMQERQAAGQAETRQTALPSELGMKFIRGVPASAGIAVGRALPIGMSEDHFVVKPEAGMPSWTLDDFRRALAKTEDQIEQLQLSVEEKLTDVASMIFSAHLLILKDDKFSGAMESLIRQGVPVADAVARVVQEYVHLFGNSNNPRLREKVQDVRDIGRRLLNNLRSGEESQSDYAGRVIVASELMPSDILKLSAQRVEGLALVAGGLTSHVAILARSLQLPMVIVEDRSLLHVDEDTVIAIDGEQGNLYINPTPDVLRNFEELRRTRQVMETHLQNVADETYTRDGQRVHVLCNINMLSEVPAALRLKAEGVGLYRSEFPFIVRNDFPSEEEQYRVYRKLIDGMGDRPVIFRTLDIGGDKMLSYFPIVNESNPFLGLRAIRFSLRHRHIFEQQLRALLRAGHQTKLHIMFPLVASVEDFTEARDIVHACMQSLEQEGIPYNRAPKLGAMIELPSAVEIVEELAAEADFLSIGGNDLVQYMLAVDRTNEAISDLYVAHHPAVLRALHRVAQAAHRHGRPVSFCGEMAADPKMIPFLVGIGIRVLSVEARQIPRVQQIVRSLDAAQAAEKARRILQMGRIRDVARALEGNGG